MGSEARAPRWSDARIVVALCVLIFASRLPLLYHKSSPEPDSLVMAAGMTMAIRGDIPIREAFLYGREGSPGMYLLGCFVYPALSDDPSHLLSFLNWVVVLASAAMAWPVYRIGRRHFSQPIAAVLAVTSLLAPAAWELSTYFHPEIPAAAFLLFAIWAALGASDSRHRALRSAIAVLLGVAAFLCRFHVLFVLPGILLAALLSPRRRYYAGLLIAAGATGAAAYAALQSLASGPERSTATGFLGYVSMIVEMYAHSFSLPGLTRSTTWAAFGVGIATALTVTAGLLLSPRDRRSAPFWRITLIGLAWLVPALLFWLPQPTPLLRHYVLPAFGLVFVLGAFLDAMPRRAGFAVACLVAVLNIATPEIAYRAYNARHPASPKSPHGAIFYQHHAVQAQIDRFAAASAGVTKALVSDSRAGAVIFVRWDGYAHILFDLARDHAGTRPLSTSTFFPGVQRRDYAVGDREVVFINYVYFEDPELRTQSSELLQRMSASSYVLFIPNEIARTISNGAAEVTVY